MRTLLFSSLFPHKGQPTLGVFVERRLRHLMSDEHIETKVIAPVPWFPFKQNVFGDWASAAKAERSETRDGLDIWHPRFLALPKIGMRLSPMMIARAGLKEAKAVIRSGFNPDLIDAHYLYPDGVAAAHLARHLKIPFVVTARGSDVTEIPAFPFARAKILAMVKEAATVITVSESLRQGLIDLGGDAAKIVTVRNGVDGAVFSPDNRDAMRKKLGLQGPTLLAAGWLIRRKRVDRVIKMMKYCPHYRLLIAGSGPEEGALRALAQQEGLGKKIQFLGRIPPDEMPDLMAASDRLILASDREGWANVLLEAMACGTPVVCTNAGGAHEFVRAPGGLVAPGDRPEDLAETLKALDQLSLSRDETRGYALGFGWRSVSAAQKAIFEKAVQGSQG